MSALPTGIVSGAVDPAWQSADSGLRQGAGTVPGPATLAGVAPSRPGIDPGLGMSLTGAGHLNAVSPSAQPGTVPPGNARTGTVQPGASPTGLAASRPSRRGQTGTATPGAGATRSLGRRALVAAVALGVLVPYVIAVVMFWVGNMDVASATSSERQGVAYLRPLIGLLAAAADQQSADVAGTPGNGQALRAAIREVDVVDARLGDGLGTHDRWTNARTRLTGLLDAAPAPTAAYAEFVQAVDLLTAMIGTVADRSQLILDPDLDTYYLMDASVIRVPSILVSAGRMTDLGRNAESARSVSMAVLAAGMVADSGNLATSLRKSFAAAQSGAATPGLVSALDAFSDAATALVPGLSITQGATPLSGPQLVTQRQRLRDTSLTLEAAALALLDDRLGARGDRLSGERWLVVGTSLTGMLLAGFGAWGLLRRRTSSADQRVDAVPARAVVGPHPGGAASGGPDGSLLWPGGPTASTGGDREAANLSAGGLAGAGPGGDAGGFGGLVGGRGDLSRRSPS